MTNDMSYTGDFYIAIDNSITGEHKEIELKNTIITGRFSDIINVLAGYTPNIRIKYLAIGTSSVATTGTETQLGTEVYRIAVTTTNNPSNGVLYTSFTVADADYTGQIEEIGIFCGTTASITVNTGTLLARVLWSHNKVAGENITFRRRDLIQ
jgi:hypothetical protein